MNRVFGILLLVVNSSTAGKLESAVFTKVPKMNQGNMAATRTSIKSIFYSVILVQRFNTDATSVLHQSPTYGLLLQQILYLLALNWGVLGLICAAIEFALKIQG